MKSMKYVRVFLMAGVLISLGGCGEINVPSEPETSICAPLGFDKATLMALRESKFEFETVSDRNRFATDLLPCLAHSDPDLRDKVAYEGLTALLRRGEISDETIETLKSSLLSTLSSDVADPHGFERPFAALALAEIARTDRVEPHFSEAERTEIVSTAKNYIASITDYRGFDAEEGWRHGVAHTADVLMQLSLNPNMTEEHRLTIRDAVASQIIPKNAHFYVYGEPERLARPILFLAAQGTFTREDWVAWFSNLSETSSPEGGWEEAYASQDGLARLHNMKAFTNAIYINANNSRNENIKALATPALDVLKTLP